MVEFRGPFMEPSEFVNAVERIQVSLDDNQMALDVLNLSGELRNTTGEERMLAGIRMATEERERILALLPADLPDAERRRRLFERFCGEPWPHWAA